MRRFLLDHNVPLSVAAYLKGEGHDVLLVRDTDPEMADSDVLQLALQEQRIVLTNDGDFMGLAPFYPDTDIILFACRQQGAEVRIQALRKTLPDLRQSIGLLIVQ